MNLTPEQEANVKARVESFKADYLELVKKHDVDFVCYPQYVQNNRGTFETAANMTIVDKKYMPIPSPIQDPSIIKS